MPVFTRVSLQRVLEAEENKDGFHDDEEFELDTPKRKNRNRSKVSVGSTVKTRFRSSSRVLEYCNPTNTVRFEGFAWSALSFRTEDPVAEEQNSSALKTRTNLTSVIVREQNTWA